MAIQPKRTILEYIFMLFYKLFVFIIYQIFLELVRVKLHVNISIIYN